MWEKIISAVSGIVVLIKVIPELVKLFEVPGFGSDKKHAVLEIFKTILDELKKAFSIEIDTARLMAMADRFIDILIGFWNLIGFFTHKDSTESPSE